MANQIPPGEYFAKCIKADLGFTNSGKEQVMLRFRLRDHDQELSWYGYFTEKATPITFKALRTAGWTGDDLSTIPDWTPGENAPDVSLSVGHELYEGKTQVKVYWVNGVGARVKNPMEGDKRKAFAAKMRGALAMFDKDNGTPKKKDDIPF